MFLETYNPFFLNVFWPNLPGAKNLSDFFFVKICQNDRNFSFFLPPPPGTLEGNFQNINQRRLPSKTPPR